MPCERFVMKDKDGNVVGSGFVCSRGKKQKPCYVCGAPSDVLCDARLPNGKTCDTPMCRKHAQHVPPDSDYCISHRSRVTVEFK